MRKLMQSAFYSFLVTLFGMSWYYVIGLFVTLSQGGDIGKFLVDCVTGGVVCFALFTFIFYELAGALEEMNRPRNRDEDSKKDDDRKDGKS